ncbi:unnamed protein product, partial [Hapterophycus canaliculatus]
TALDESGQTVQFRFRHYLDGGAPRTSGASSLFRIAPTILTTGLLSIFPNPQVSGLETVVFRATDQTPPSDDATDAELEAAGIGYQNFTFTINVDGVNDPPILNTSLNNASSDGFVPTAEFAPDERPHTFEVLDDGTLVLGLSEDNALVVPYRIRVEDAGGNPNSNLPPGILDLFLPGPADE